MAIDWNIFDYKQGAGRNYNAIVQGDQSDYATLQEVWKFVFTTVLSDSRGYAWDYIRTEFWVDSGHIAIFPASFSTKKLDANTFVYVVFEQILEQYERLADSDVDDERFSEEIAKILASWTLASETAAKSLDLAKLANRASVRIKFYEAGEEQALREFVVPTK